MSYSFVATTNALPIRPSLSLSFPHYHSLSCSQSLKHSLPCSRLQEISVASDSQRSENDNNNIKWKENKDDEEEVGISKIQVPRQKHIPVSKSQLLDAILSLMLNQDTTAHHFRLLTSRGYATEKQNGLLIVEKLDYLQSKLLQTIFFVVSKPLANLGTWINELYETVSQKREVHNWTEKLKLWLKELSVFKKSLLYNDNALDEQTGVNQVQNAELPIWLAAQRAVARYEGILSPVGPRERLLRRLLSWIGLIPATPETPFQVENDGDSPEPYLRPTFLSRISLSDTWRPASRKYCGNDPWKMLKTSISILFSQSVLQEPAFEELILLYTEEVGETNGKDTAEVPSLQLKIYERIPFPDLPVVFPHKKLSFRIIDTVRLDAATILGLLAYFINYKFVNVLSSPSAVLLDVVAISALIIYGSRVALGYKQTWDRYQLLVNKTLYEKTLASGFGSVHFLLDASEQQQYKEAILAYAVLLKADKGQVTSRQSVGEKCERFMYEVFKVKVEMPVDKALNTLLRLNLATETCIDGRHGLLAIPCPQAYEALKERWNSLLC
ncbi:uncharacterized protein [Cicer arietinum]|uniref:Uncharacterized protein LOC101503998 isoform X4 n=1 Tax=Cicer arietinum TaxID=3827 RepID=A0A1S2XIB2_CICAR|nr:uncharacterized protein LOC101503998 isoform X4 [Cicer arietinum]